MDWFDLLAVQGTLKGLDTQPVDYGLSFVLLLPEQWVGWKDTNQKHGVLTHECVGGCVCSREGLTMGEAEAWLRLFQAPAWVGVPGSTSEPGVPALQ